MASYRVELSDKTLIIRRTGRNRIPFRKCYKCNGDITVGSLCGYKLQGFGTVSFCATCLGDPIEEDTNDADE